MKRCDGLAPLSREHHAALVLAKRVAVAQRVAASREEWAAVVTDTFAQELDPHFRTEEAVLLPQLMEAGETEFVARTLREHDELRELVRRIGAGDADALWPFGAKLDAHVRFEERTLFPIAEAVLSPEALARVADLHQERSAAAVTRRRP
jgi:uncharacterized protein (DUF2249 family)/iron-sulfur cluster repair protein YtfE (RIC family)